jgi:hypothetical protein
LAWSDGRWGDGEIYFARLDAAGARIGSEIRATNNSADQIPGGLAWSGEQYALAWYDYRDGGPSIYVRLLDHLGGTVGPETPVTGNPAGASDPSLAWTGNGFGLAWSHDRGDTVPDLDVYFAIVGCCPDSDGDGYARCTDCDDTNPLVHPGAPEICNGVDDNCSGQTDEGFGRITCGLGICRRTVDQCVGGVPQACIPGAPSAEICDGLDNDCNSLVDDDSAGLDSDADGIHNACDNCRSAYNPTQQDTDHDGFGNACDNCVGVANANQADLDADQRGNVCDNCPAQYNPTQDDFDADTVGDVCDNCLTMSNPDQGDIDLDFEGNVCDLNDGLILLNLTDEFTVEWQQESGFEGFNLYRGDLAVLKSSGLYTQDPNVVPLAGRECGLADVSSFDVSDPPVGKAAFFLVSGIHLGVEGSLGKNSAGVERVNTNPCP